MTDPGAKKSDRPHMNIDPIVRLVDPFIPPGPRRRIFGAANQLIARLDEGRGRMDARRLVTRIHQLGSYDSKAREARRELRGVYAEYTSTISTPKMAISLELAAFLRVFSSLVRPTRVLDLGSGFSSFVFRLYEVECPQNVTVCSVDNSEGWLSKTVAFLSAHQMPTDFVFSWDEFQKRNHESFDLILHDLGNFETRARTLETVLTRVAPSGFVVLDDMHKFSYYRSVERVLREHGLTHFSLQCFTRDDIGRFSELVVNEKSRS